ncbi:hypothetical protein TA3x_000809 [Tundrisphaera sp. TA3]|uniref:hypothetical protein n=1 Tax=Tundrisphaera sp. TA3 TaxID=3435775 RepID=UPI003EB74003
MKAVILQDADGAHLSFVLFSPGLGADSGDCVFMAVPGQVESFGTPVFEDIYQRRQAGESTWEVTHREPIAALIRTPGIPAELFIELGEPGQWGTGVGTARQVLGKAALAHK